MRAIPSLTSSTVPTSSTSSSCRSAASISRRRMSLISPGRSVVSVAIRCRRNSGGRVGALVACEKYHKEGISCKWRCFFSVCNRLVLVPADLVRILAAMAASIRDLKVWQEAVALAAEIVRSSRQNARRETKVVTDQLMVTALAAAGAIADGYGRYTAPEQRQLYRAAKRDLLRLETQIAIARQADLLSVQTHAELTHRIQSVSRLLGGYLVYLERQLTQENLKPT